MSQTDGADDEPAASIAVTGPVYEMLWDCPFCSTKKLLGLTHRHCPVCGAPQAADARYFPPDDEKVPAKDHVYYGVDRKCGACGEANSRASKCCRGCGAPLDGTQDVARRSDQSPLPLAGASTPKPKAKGRPLLIFAVIVAVLGCIAWLLTWSKPSKLQVAGHEWRREIAIERFGPIQESAWCDSVPFGAQVTHRAREVRGHRQVEDGQECSTRKVDLGNGGFSEERDCHPHYRSEPIYDQRCTYLVDRWQRERSAVAQGASLRDAPKWPAVRLARTGQCVGCEREGARSETYTVILKDPKGKTHRCDFDQSRWQGFDDGEQLEGKLGVVTGVVSCGSLRTR
jgi:hypothetical protein